MLHELHLKNYIIFEDERINFTKGLNIITGETGSGKSIVIDAIGILCGDRFTKEDIRAGVDKAFIEGIFEINIKNNELNAILNEYGLSPENDNLLLIQREVSNIGRSFSRINGHAVTLSMLKNIMEHILDIVAQNEHQRLFRPSFHMGLVDNFGTSELTDLKILLIDLTSQIEKLDKELSELYGKSREREKKLDFLKYQIEEIKNSNLKPDELDKLKNRRAVILNAEKIFNTVSGIYEVLYENRSFNKSIIDNLGNCFNDINNIQSIDTAVSEFGNIIANSLYQLEDLKSSLRDYRDGIEFNSNEIEAIEERLSLIEKLSKKYGETIEKIFEYQKEAEAEYERLKNSEKSIMEMNEILKYLKKEYFNEANKLSNMRNNISKELELKIEKELNELNMEGAKFLVKNEINENLIHKNGIDKIEFFLSANPGEVERPLIKVASGGETSRILLALKMVLIKAENVQSIIFDEIDAGIGGETTNMVANKLKWISSIKQTLCITHLPQIASIGDNHLHVYKFIDEDITYATIKKITGDERIVELAKMLDGGKESKLSFGLAKELLGKTK
ncbi:MAG: DNA repair protein RecN [Clostridiales bacterium]|nr:DNA repair protein RecN [Clostridiales bacterium]